MVIHNIRLAKQSTVGDVINVLKTKVSTDLSYYFIFFWHFEISRYKEMVDRLLEFIQYLVFLKQVELSRSDAELRLLEVFYHKIYKVFAACWIIIIFTIIIILYPDSV